MAKQFISVMDAWREGVEIPELVSAVEEKGVYYFDRYDRYKKADPADCLKGLEFMWDWKHGDAAPIHEPEFGAFYDPSLQLESFGWDKDDLPPFEAFANTLRRVSREGRKINNLLKIIAALCERLKIDWKTCSGAELVRAVELAGYETVSDDTARKYLDDMIKREKDGKMEKMVA